MNQLEKMVWAVAYSVGLAKYNTMDSPEKSTRLATCDADESVLWLRQIAVERGSIHRDEDLQYEEKIEQGSQDISKARP